MNLTIFIFSKALLTESLGRNSSVECKNILEENKVYKKDVQLVNDIKIIRKSHYNNQTHMLDVETCFFNASDSTLQPNCNTTNILIPKCSGLSDSKKIYYKFIEFMETINTKGMKNEEISSDSFIF